MVVSSRSSFNVKIHEDKATPALGRAEFLSDGRLILCDYQSYKRKIRMHSCDYTMKDTGSLKLQSGPMDVSAVNSSTVIITLPGRKQLQYVHVMPQFKLSSNIQLDKRCNSVAEVGDEIFTSCYNGGNHMMGRSGYLVLAVH